MCVREASLFHLHFPALGERCQHGGKERVGAFLHLAVMAVEDDPVVVRFSVSIADNRLWLSGRLKLVPLPDRPDRDLWNPIGLGNGRIRYPGGDRGYLVGVGVVSGHTSLNSSMGKQ